MKTLNDWRELAETVRFPRALHIDGKPVEAIGGATLSKINPATGEVLADVAMGDGRDVDLAVSAARRAFEDGRWSHKSPGERRQILLKLAELIEGDAENLALLESLDMGKPVAEALAIDVPGAAAVWRFYAEANDKLYDEVAPAPRGDLAMIRRVPLGVVAAIVPWNFPFDMAAWKCAPALAAGNSVVLKPSERSPFTALRLAELAAEAGIPEGVLNVVTGLGSSAGKALGLHSDVDCLAFTGSTRIGHQLLEYSGQSNGKPVWLELGGKSPNNIFADVDDIDAAADKAAFGIFFNAGQVCSANSRLLVHSSIKDALLDRLIHRAKAMYPGNPLDPECRMGALVDSAHAAGVQGHVERARQSARLVTGGKRADVHPGGAFFEPTIFDNVDPGSPLATEEVFGPVLGVTTFEDEEQAVRLANDTRYGLAASVWTGSIDRALRMADRLHVGTVSVNTVDALSPQTPFGGLRQSGYGRDLSLHSLDKYTGLKTVWIKYK